MGVPLNVAIIGVGGIATTHMPGWQASDHAQVVAGSDLNETSLQAWGKEHAIKKLVADSGDLINDPDIDIIDICTPNMYHTPLAIAALQAGKHVICEKPLASTPQEIDQIIAARDQSGKMLMTAQHMRFEAGAQAMKKNIAQGVLGDIYHARSWMLRRYALPIKPTFLYKKHSGGGPCIDIGVHVLDLTLWMMDFPKPVAVCGTANNRLSKLPGAFSLWGGKIPKDMDVEDFAAAFIRFENGANLILETSWMLHHQCDHPIEDKQMWLYGTKGGSRWPQCEIYRTDNDKQQRYDTKVYCEAQPLEAHAQECVSFAQAIVDQTPSPVPAEQSRQVMQILAGLYQSQEQGREIRLD